ncbi:hypothetical protein QE380_000217 [Acinetobacter baylyi]|uniref:Uncharacterized protein n=1 Tax=Acinetobacter baylyi TaxID=202950 RepID=A0ABU0URW5_ACIBI|nr:hypothetical protein [Acinetobacter baylyi]MDQ1207294.1 hypothetical protein [Acinetobacter baylyi]MDR6105624.1 hypothetical protein [Acinetobacter baylyi]MDR6187655.1 hypothetical protein [Acinetobacter baylyi]
MADELITKQELIDAKVDAKDLGEAVNNNSSGIVTPRYGTPYATAPAAIQKIESDGAAAIAKLESTGGFITVATLADLQAIIPVYENQAARVNETGDEYSWNPDVLPNPKWEPTGRNYIQDSKVYTDNEVAAALTTASNDASTKAENAENNAKNYVNLKLVNFGPRSGYLGGYSTESGLMLLGFRTSDGRPIFGNGGDFITDLETQKNNFNQTIEVVSANPRSGILGGIKTPSGMLLISFDAKTGKPILAGVDVIQEIEKLKNNGSSSEAKVQFLPNNHLAGWGDSLTGAGSSGDWLSKLAANIGLPFYNGGIGGQGSKSIAARQGAVPVLFNAFTIPAATTAVAVTLKNDFSPCSSGGAAQQLTVNNIVGNLIRDSSGNHTFTRLVAGSDVVVPQGTPGYSVLGETYSKSLQFIGTGRNSFSNMTPAEIVATVSAMINNQRTQIKRFIVWSFPYFPSDSSTQKANVDAVNNALKAAFPQYFVDIKNWLCTTSPVTFGSTTINDPFTVLGITPTSQDLTDAAAGLTPVSLRSAVDDGHFNQNCGTAIAYRMQRELEIKGWI